MLVAYGPVVLYLPRYLSSSRTACSEHARQSYTLILIGCQIQVLQGRSLSNGSYILPCNVFIMKWSNDFCQAHNKMAARCCWLAVCHALHVSPSCNTYPQSDGLYLKSSFYRWPLYDRARSEVHVVQCRRRPAVPGQLVLQEEPYLSYWLGVILSHPLCHRHCMSGRWYLSHWLLFMPHGQWLYPRLGN